MAEKLPVGGRSGKPRPRGKRATDADRQATGRFPPRPDSPAKGPGYGGEAKGFVPNDTPRAEPITPGNSAELSRRAFSPDAVAKREARDAIAEEMLAVQLDYVRRGGESAWVVAEKVLDRVKGRATQPLAGDGDGAPIPFVVFGERESPDTATWAEKYAPKPITEH